jgi:phosphoglycolate phosphatase-like HAD superfamily hydrolase
MNKKIFIDLDGPLIDGVERHYGCYSYILKKLGYKPIKKADYWNAKRNMQSRLDLLKLSGCESLYDEFVSLWLELIESDPFIALDQIQDEALNELDRWKAKGYEIYLVTLRQNQEQLRAQLYDLELFSRLDKVFRVDYQQGGAGKAAIIMSEFPSDDFESSIWIGDTEADTKAARTLGCKLCLITNGLRNEGVLKAHEPDWLCSSIKDISSKNIIN